MFEGDWHGLDSAQSKPMSEPPCMLDMNPEFFEGQPMYFFPPEPPMDFQMFQMRSIDDNKDFPSSCYFPVPEWCMMQEQVFPQSNTNAEENPEPSAEAPKETSGHSAKAAQFQHTKQVGTLTIEQRQAKIQRYLEKRRRRSFHKKVVYLCRKRVADTRLRVKGRFVAKHLAASLKGLENDKNNVILPGEKRT